MDAMKDEFTVVYERDRYIVMARIRVAYEQAERSQSETKLFVYSLTCFFLSHRKCGIGVKNCITVFLTEFDFFLSLHK